MAKIDLKLKAKLIHTLPVQKTSPKKKSPSSAKRQKPSSSSSLSVNTDKPKVNKGRKRKLKTEENGLNQGIDGDFCESGLGSSQSKTESSEGGGNRTNWTSTDETTIVDSQQADVKNNNHVEIVNLTVVVLHLSRKSPKKVPQRLNRDG